MSIKPFEEMTEKELRDNCIIKGYEQKPCMMCGKMTYYIDYCSEAHFCCKKCVNNFYKLLNNA